MALRREHVVGIRTDLSSCKVHVAPFGKSASGLIYPCDNLLILSDPSSSSGNQSYIETTKPDNRLVAYNVSNNGTLLALAENSPSSGSPSGSLVTLYSLSAANNSKSITAKKKKVIQLESDTLHVSFVDSTHILVLGNSPDYNLTLWSTGTASLPASPGGTRHPRHPGGCLASIKLATPSEKSIYRAEVSPTKDESGNALVCITGDGILRLFRLSTANNTFRPVTVNLKRKQQNYISQLWLSSGQIALGTDSGEILIIANNATQTILKLPEPHAIATCLAKNSKGDLVVGSDGATMHFYEAAQDTKGARFRHKASTCVSNNVDGANPSITSLPVSAVGDQDVFYTATSDNRLMTVPFDSILQNSSCGATKIQPAIPSFLSSRENVCANSIDVCSWRPLVAISSSDSGTNESCVQIWNYHTRKLEASKGFSSDGQIQSICFHPSSFQLTIGTKEKIIVCDLVRRINHSGGGDNDDGCPSTIKSSGQIDMASAITLCRYSNGGQYLAVCCGSAVTIYDAFSLMVISALRGHSADLVEIRFQDGDQNICTIGGDGVLCVWSIVSGRKILRHVNALSSYRSGAIDGKFSQAIVCGESSVSKIELNLREKSSKEKVLAKEEVWGKLQMSSCGRLIVGVAAGTEGDNKSALVTCLPNIDEMDASPQKDVASSIQQISSLGLFGQNLFVASSTGSIHHFTMNLLVDQPPVEGTEVKPAHHAILSDQVLVSENDLIEKRMLMKSLEQRLAEIQQQNANDIQVLDDKCHDTLKAIQEQSQLDGEEHQRKCQEATKQRINMEQDFNKATANAEKEHSAKMKSIEEAFGQKIESEIERAESIQEECASKTRKWKREIENMEHQTAKEIQRISCDFNERTENELQLQAKLSKKQEELLDRHHKLTESLESTGDDEITGIMLARERELLVEQKATRQLREEQAILKAKLDSLVSDLDEQKDTIESLHEKEADLVASIDEVKDYIRQRQYDVKSQDDELSAKRAEEIDLKAKCNELKQRHARLEEEIVHRNAALSQIEADIVDKEKTAAEIRANLAESKRAHSNVNLTIANLKDKALGLDRERQRQKRHIEERTEYAVELEKDIFDLVSVKKNGHGEIKAKLLPLCTKYLKPSGDSSSSVASMRSGPSSFKRGSETKESESQRREIHLRKKVQTIKAAMVKAEKKHAQDIARLRWQQKVLKQHLSEMNCPSDVASDFLPVEKENTANIRTSDE